MHLSRSFGIITRHSDKCLCSKSFYMYVFHAIKCYEPRLPPIESAFLPILPKLKVLVVVAHLH